MQLVTASGHRRTYPSRNEVEWLTDAQKAEYRKTLKTYLDIATNLEMAVRMGVSDPFSALNPAQMAKVKERATSTDPQTVITQFYVMWNNIQQDYTAKLIKMAPHCLYAYHEAMNPTEAPDSKHIKLIVDSLMDVDAGKIGTLLMAIPAGCAKTTYASKSFIQWHMGRWPDKKVMAIGNSKHFVENLISKPNRDAMMSDTYRAIFPDVELDKNSRSVAYWELEGFDAAYKCAGAGSAISGIRADLVAGDDLYRQAAEAKSELIRKKTWDWFTADVMLRRLSSAPIILVNTIFHSEDVMSTLLRMMDEDEKRNKEAAARGEKLKYSLPYPYRKIILEAECTDAENDPLGRAEGEFIWPEVYTVDDWEQKKETLSAEDWACICQNHPLDTVGDELSLTDFAYFEKYPVNAPDQPVEFTRTIATVDTANKATQRADWTVVSVFRLRSDGIWCMIDMWRKKSTLSQLATAVRRLNTTYSLDSVVVEDAGMGSQLIQEYQGKLQVPLIPYVPQGKGSKEFRADKMFPYIIAGKILFPKNTGWMQDVIRECVGFPNAKHDDIVDTLSILVDHIFKYRAGGTKPLKRSSKQTQATS